MKLTKICKESKSEMLSTFARMTSLTSNSKTYMKAIACFEAFDIENVRKPTVFYVFRGYKKGAPGSNVLRRVEPQYS